jgi:hypothetical protein
VAGADLDAELAALPEMTWPDLRLRWREFTGRPAPRVKHALLRMALAYELQAVVYGALSPRSQQRLERLSGAGAAKAPKDKKLVREWKGVLHTVTICEDQTIHWNGKQWNSLSEVARAITGSRWSGPVFFGLKSARKAA